MIMNKRILYLLSVLCFFSFSACTSEEEPVLTEELGEIWLSVVDTSKVEVVTRALSGFDVKDFNVSLSRGETMARLAKDTSFTVKPVEPTEVTLKCVLANSSVNVEFSDFIKKNLSDYPVRRRCV